MKKKNVIGHMEANRKETEGWFQRLHLLPRLICLLIAIIIWLCVVNLKTYAMPESPDKEVQTEASDI